MIIIKNIKSLFVLEMEQPEHLDNDHKRYFDYNNFVNSSEINLNVLVKKYIIRDRI